MEDTEEYKKNIILVCEYNEAIKEAIRIINCHSASGAHRFDLPTTYNYVIGEPLRTQITNELKSLLKKP